MATRDDWQNKAMPNSKIELSIDLEYSASQMAKIRAGHIPDGMDDKWFVYYEKPQLFIHRSWTGY